MSFVIHKRGQCKNAYYALRPATFNNTRCILLHVRNEGILNPEDVTFNEKTWLENSAELLGINNKCIVAQIPYTTFAYTDKIPLFLEYLKECDYEYALISDSVDSVIQANPDNAVDLLDYYDCEILYSTTRWADHDDFTMPANSKFNSDKFTRGVFLNAGVCIGKVSALVKLFTRVLDYAAYEPIRYYHPTYRKTNGYMNWSPERLSKFPHGCSSEQTIIRYLVKEFWPVIKLDVEHKLAKRR